MREAGGELGVFDDLILILNFYKKDMKCRFVTHSQILPPPIHHPSSVLIIAIAIGVSMGDKATGGGGQAKAG